MRLLLLFAQGLLLLSFQTTFFGPMGFSAFQCQLWLVPVVYGALRWELNRALLLSFLLGYASDVFSGGVQGIGALSALGTAFGAYWMRKGLLLRSSLQLGMMAGPMCLLYQAFYLTLGYLVEGKAWIEDLVISRIILQPVVLAITAPVIVEGSQWVEGLGQSRFAKRRSE